MMRATLAASAPMRSAIAVTFNTEIDYSAPRNEALMRLIFGVAMLALGAFWRSFP
jgi:hypothetical protein